MRARLAPFSPYGVQADDAGLSPDVDLPHDPALTDWSDVFFTTWRRQEKRLQTLFAQALRGKRMITLNIPDRFAADHTALAALPIPSSTQH